MRLRMHQDDALYTFFWFNIMFTSVSINENREKPICIICQNLVSYLANVKIVVSTFSEFNYQKHQKAVLLDEDLLKAKKISLNDANATIFDTKGSFQEI